MFWRSVVFRIVGFVLICVEGREGYFGGRIAGVRRRFSGGFRMFLFFRKLGFVIRVRYLVRFVWVRAFFFDTYIYFV